MVQRRPVGSGSVWACSRGLRSPAPGIATFRNVLAGKGEGCPAGEGEYEEWHSGHVEMDHFGNGTYDFGRPFSHRPPFPSSLHGWMGSDLERSRGGI